MKQIRKQVLSLWQNNNRLAISAEDVPKALGGEKAHQKAIRAMLAELVGEGVLTLERKQYKLAAPSKSKQPESQREKLPEIVEGVFSANPNGFGFVDLKDDSRRSFFVPPPAIGPAMDKDLVRASIQQKGNERPIARVIEVLRRSRTLVRGYVQKEYGYAWAVPLNEKIPAVQLNEMPGKGEWSWGSLVEVEITHYPESVDQPPMGRVVQLLDDDDSADHILGHILADEQVPTGFTPETEAEMDRLPREVKPPKDREDLTGLTFVTIDGEDAKDFDDAVYLEKLPNGHDRLLVAVADVAEYVRPGSAVDADAIQKGTSIYLPDRVFPMLPEALSNELCSLKPKVVRLALVCDMEIDNSGDVVDYRLYEASILSKARLTYTQVKNYLEGDKKAVPGGDIPDMLTHMKGLYLTLKNKRHQRGAIAMELPEFRFDLDEDGLPVKVRKVYPNDATRLIEQFMLEANETVARHATHLGISILFRVHEPPQEESIYNLSVLLSHFGIEFPMEDMKVSGGFNRLLKMVDAHPARDQIELTILRAMSQAQYRHVNDGHYGLAATHYTHFTSPIRRYPDLLLHRALKSAMAAAKGKATPAFKLPADAGATTSFTERRASGIEGRMNRLFRVIYMEKYLGQQFAARVTGVTERGVWLELTDHNVEGFLSVDSLPGDRYQFDRQRSRLTGRVGNRQIGFGQTLLVELAQADRHTQRLDFGFVEWVGNESQEEDNGGAKRQPQGRSSSSRGKEAPKPAQKPSKGKKTASMGQSGGRGSKGAESPQGGPGKEKGGRGEPASGQGASKSGRGRRRSSSGNR